MLFFGLFMGVLLIVIGGITYVLAPRVGPNPIFGVRVGYAYASREVWDKTNRFGGLLIALTGVEIAILGLVLQSFGFADSVGMPALTIILIASMLAATAWMFVYARSQAQGEPIAQKLPPVQFRWTYIAPVLVTFVLVIAMVVYFYPQLPAEHLATHFGFDDQPNGWSSRDGFLLTFAGMAGVMVLIDLGVVLIATREPLVAVGRWGRKWWLGPERGLLFMGIALSFANLVLLAALWDVAWFNLYGAHAFPLSMFFWILIPVIVGIIALFFVLAKRDGPLDGSGQTN